MRNLLQYPVTKQEIINCLKEFAAEVSPEESCGDMRPLLLAEAILIIDKMYGSFQAWKSWEEAADLP